MRMNLTDEFWPVILPGDQVVSEHHDHTVLTVLALVHWPVGSPEVISQLQSTMQPSPFSFSAYTCFNQSSFSIYIKLPRSVSPMYQKPTPVKLPSKSASSARKSICLKRFRSFRCYIMHFNQNLTDWRLVLPGSLPVVHRPVGPPPRWGWPW